MLDRLDGLLNPRFFSNLFPIPAANSLLLGQTPPDFVLPDITNRSTARLSSYHQQKPVILAFTRIFTEKVYCPLCYPHIVELNQRYEELTNQGVEVLLITSTDNRQSTQVVKDLGLKMPVLSNPSCDVFQTYQVGQALGAPLPAQLVIDATGKLRYKHLFSFLSPNAGVDRLLAVIATIHESELL